MKFFLLPLFLLCWIFSVSQNEIQDLLQSTDWKLINAESYGWGGKLDASEIHEYSVTADSVLSITYCYIRFQYKIQSLSANSLILMPLTDQDSLENLIFENTVCTSEKNPNTSSQYLSFNPMKYRIIIDDSLGIKAEILDQYYRKVELEETNQENLNHFILNNRFNDTHQDFFIFETKNGDSGVISYKEEIIIEPKFQNIIIDYDNLKMESRTKFSIPIICIDEEGKRSNEIYFY